VGTDECAFDVVEEWFVDVLCEEGAWKDEFFEGGEWALV